MAAMAASTPAALLCPSPPSATPVRCAPSASQRALPQPKVKLGARTLARDAYQRNRLYKGTWELFGSFNQPRLVASMANPAAAAAAVVAAEPLGAGSPSPALFDGTTRLYHNKACPWAHRVVIAANYKHLDEIERVEINLRSKPEWYTERVYPLGKVPALEHNGKVVGESLDLLFYLDEHFGGPEIVPKDESKASFAKEVVDGSVPFAMGGYVALQQLFESGTAADVEAALGDKLDALEQSLNRYQAEGPFFLGTFSYVDIAFLPFLERFRITFQHFCNADIAANRPNLTKWFEAVEQIPEYTSTRMDRQTMLDNYKAMLEMRYFGRLAAAAPTPQTTASK